ncbi:T9SS type A sorting domain-containing protein [uncultured Flavobacterium sp.]|uniref:T9SS type A sorting domain-containing protein n=1 Tax=uncultured Flavobacterium sp. TaxID=165435 RepID=UPI0030CA26B7
MKKNLLFILLFVILFTANSQAQNKVWDFGNDVTNFPVGPELSTTTVVDGLTLEPGGGSGFGVVESNSATWFADTAAEYVSVNRFKGGGNSNVDPSDGVTFMPTRRYLSFPVEGPVAVKIWMRQSGTSLPRALWVTDGTAAVTHYDGLGDTDPQYMEANYTGGAGNLYILCAGNAYNLYKIEISSTLLGLNDLVSPVETNIRSVKNKIYVYNTKTSTDVKIYSITGALVKEFKTNSDIDFDFKAGIYIATLTTADGKKSVKLSTY